MDEKTKRNQYHHCSASYSLESSTTTVVRRIRKQHPRILLPKFNSVVSQCFQPKAFGGKKTQSLSRKKESNTDDKLDRWMIASFQALFAVDLLEFREFVEASNSSYNLCSLNTVKVKILVDYELLEASVIQVLGHVSSPVSMTLGSRTSDCAKQCFMVINPQWIDKKFKP